MRIDEVECQRVRQIDLQPNYLPTPTRIAAKLLFRLHCTLPGDGCCRDAHFCRNVSTASTTTRPTVHLLIELQAGVGPGRVAVAGQKNRNEITSADRGRVPSAPRKKPVLKHVNFCREHQLKSACPPGLDASSRNGLPTCLWMRKPELPFDTRVSRFLIWSLRVCVHCRIIRAIPTGAL